MPRPDDVSRVPVVDAEGKTVGFVDLSDLYEEIDHIKGHDILEINHQLRELTMDYGPIEKLGEKVRKLEEAIRDLQRS